MKLSEAIRHGATMQPMARFSMRAPDGSTCALGAALDALGLLHPTLSYAIGKAPEAWRPVVVQPCRCPVCDEPFSQVDTAIIHINNYEPWTREQIADWVERFEQSPATPASDPHGDSSTGKLTMRDVDPKDPSS